MRERVTPATFRLPAKAGFFSREKYTFEFEKKGYLPASSSLNGKLDAWYFGNIVFGGLIGVLIVDPATGAMWKLDDRVVATLSPDPNYDLEKASSTAEKSEPSEKPPRKFLQDW